MGRGWTPFLLEGSNNIICHCHDYIITWEVSGQINAYLFPSRFLETFSFIITGVT